MTSSNPKPETQLPPIIYWSSPNTVLAEAENEALERVLAAWKKLKQEIGDENHTGISPDLHRASQAMNEGIEGLKPKATNHEELQQLVNLARELTQKLQEVLAGMNKLRSQGLKVSGPDASWLPIAVLKDREKRLVTLGEQIARTLSPYIENNLFRGVKQLEAEFVASELECYILAARNIH